MVEQKSRRGNRKKNHEKANNSPSYRCAAIKNCQFYPKITQIREVQMLKTNPLPQKKNAVIYYQTLERFLDTKLENLKK